MRKGLSILAALILVGLLAVGWHYYGGTTVPAGQPALMSLTTRNFDELRTSFNLASGDVRIVLLLSPT
jgi:hypothetical protein